MGLASKKSVRVMGIGLAVLLLAVVGVKLFLPAEKIRDLALAQAQARLGREVSVGEVAVSLRGGLGVRLADFVVHNPAGFAGAHLVATKAVDLKLEIGPLIKGEVRVNRLVVEAPVVNLVRQADGSDNFTFVTPAVTDTTATSPDTGAEAAPAPPPLSVASLKLQGGQVSFSDATVVEAGLQAMQLSDLNLNLSLADPTPGRFQTAGNLSVARIEIVGPPHVPDLTAAADFDLTWDATASELDITTLDLVVNDTPVAVSGHLVTAEKAPVGALKINVAEITLAQLVAYLPLESAARFSRDSANNGTLKTAVEVTLGADETAHATGTVNASGLVLAEPDLPPLSAAVDFDVMWHTVSSQLDITRIEAKVNDLPLSCWGQVSTAGSAPTGQIQVQTHDLELADLVVFLPPELATKLQGHRNPGKIDADVELTLTGNKTVPVHSSGAISMTNVDLAIAQPFLPPGQPGTLAGHGDLDLTFVDKTGDPAQMTYAGTLTTRGVSFTESGLVDELEDLDAKLQFTQDKFTVEQCRAQFASGRFTLTGSLQDPFPYFLPPEMQGDGEMKTPYLSFDLRSPKLDVDRLLPAASPTEAGADQSGGSATRKTSVPTDLEFPGLSCDGTFSADSLIYMQVPLTQVTGKVKIRDRKFSAYEVQGAVFHGEVDGQVDVDLNDLNDPVYRGQYQARDIEVDNFMTRFAGLAGVVFGGCNMSGGFDAHGLDPEGIRNSLSLNADAGIKQGKVMTAGNVHTALNKLANQAGQNLNQEQALRDLATHISVENGRVGVSALKTRLGQFGDVTIDGYYGFNGDLSYNGTVLLTEAQTTQLFNGSSMLRELGRLLGSERPARLALPLSVGGTRVSPKVKLDLSSVTDDLQKRVVKEQGRKLEDEAKSKLGDLLKKFK